MNVTKVAFKNPADILNFVDIIRKYPFDMDLKCGNVVVDAKSLFGIMSLGFNHDVCLKVYADDCAELLADIQNYITV